MDENYLKRHDVLAVIIAVILFCFFVSKYPSVDKPSSEDTKHETDKDKEENKSTEDSPTKPDNIPLASFVVEIDGEKDEGENAESVM